MCSGKRPGTDVLAHPHKEPLMSALTVKDAGTYKDSIVVRLLKTTHTHTRKKRRFCNEDCEQQTIPVDNLVSNNTV